ncbi:MAG: acyltransferase [Alistipes sp.]|nr:acyltransferase [Alistipes sp.]
MSRQSNFEAYRIVCILLIVVMHTFGAGTGQLNTQLGILINVIGNIGVTGFVLLSGYFGIRLKWKKLAKMDIMLIFWSLAAYAGAYLATGIFSVKELLTCFIPVISHKYWFISAYFCLCVLSPFINEYLERIDRKRHRQLIVGAGALFLFLPTVFFFDQTGDGGKGIINMVLAYVVGRYIGMYHKDRVISKGRIIAGLLGTVVINFALNDGIYWITGSQANYFARDNSLFTMVQAVLLLLLFMGAKFENRFVNALAANVLAVYILEDALKTHLQAVFPYMAYMEKGYYIGIASAVSLAVFLAAVLLEEIRKRIFGGMEDKVIDKAGGQVAKWIK